MKDLVAKLPQADQQFRDSDVSDATIGAILGILFETVKHSADFTRFLISLGSRSQIFKVLRKLILDVIFILKRSKYDFPILHLCVVLGISMSVEEPTDSGS